MVVACQVSFFYLLLMIYILYSGVRLLDLLVDCSKATYSRVQNNWNTFLVLEKHVKFCVKFFQIDRLAHLRAIFYDFKYSDVWITIVYNLNQLHAKVCQSRKPKQ